jgi:hypothetical protein
MFAGRILDMSACSKHGYATPLLVSVGSWMRPVVRIRTSSMLTSENGSLEHSCSLIKLFKAWFGMQRESLANFQHASFQGCAAAHPAQLTP